MKIVKFKKNKILDESAKCTLVTEIDFDEDSKKPINFCVLLLFQSGEIIYEIIKYDGTHRSCHVHKYYEKLNSIGESCLPSQINSKSITCFKDDVKANWKSYVAAYRKKLKI